MTPLRRLLARNLSALDIRRLRTTHRSGSDRQDRALGLPDDLVQRAVERVAPMTTQRDQVTSFCLCHPQNLVRRIAFAHAFGHFNRRWSLGPDGFLKATLPHSGGDACPQGRPNMPAPRRHPRSESRHMEDHEAAVMRCRELHDATQGVKGRRREVDGAEDAAEQGVSVGRG